MLGQGVIEPEHSPRASLAVFTPNMGGNLRFFFDYCRLTAMTPRGTYPVLKMDESIDSLGDASIFTTLDCSSGYWQIMAAERDRNKISSPCHAGLFRYERMLLALTNEPTTFQRTLNIVLARHKWQSCLVSWMTLPYFQKTSKSVTPIWRRCLIALPMRGHSQAYEV